MRKKITTLSALMIFSETVIPCAFGQTNTTYTIKQERYTYKMQVTQTVTAETFVITEGGKTDKKMYSKKAIDLDIKESGISTNKNGISTNKKTLRKAVLATCLFQFDSPVLMPSEADKILAVLSKKKLKNTPLTVTGYTCSLGPDEHNQTLSLQRAETVAHFLRRHGFIVAAVQDKGSLNPVTNEPRQFHLNRRVTVRVVQK